MVNILSKVAIFIVAMIFSIYVVFIIDGIYLIGISMAWLLIGSIIGESLMDTDIKWLGNKIDQDLTVRSNEFKSIKAILSRKWLLGRIQCDEKIINVYRNRLLASMIFGLGFYVMSIIVIVRCMSE